jgi:glycosyltransferase involved in cell wall biosynthesis
MTDKPLLTFALFGYNQEKYIREAIEGAFAQTYSPLEIILSDDCSSDGTFAIMHEMAAAYRGPHKVRAVQTPRNLGLIQHLLLRGREAEGEVVVVAAGDDISLAGRVAALAPAFGPDVGAAYSLCDQVDEQGNLMNSAIERGSRPRSFDRRIARAMSLKGNIGHVRVTQGSAAAYRAEVFQVPVDANRKSYSEEMLLCFYCHLLGMRVALVEESLVAYRQRPGAMTNMPDDERSARARRPENLSRFARRANIDMYFDFHQIAAQHDPQGRIDRAALFRNLREEEIKFFWIDLTIAQRFAACISSLLEGRFDLAAWCLSRLLGVYGWVRKI